MAPAQSKRPTLHDVADVANVSYQTVSRVINHHPNVAETTRKRVLRAIRKLNYRPNQAAKTLATGRSHIIQLVTYDLRYNDPLPPMLHWAKQHGYTMIISEIKPTEPKESIQEMLEDLVSRMIDGLVVFTPYPSISHQDVLSVCQGCPTVFAGIGLGVNAPSVVYDQQYGTRLAIEHLLELGHRHIAEIMGPQNHHDAQTRHETYLTVIEEHDIPPGPSVQGNFRPPSGYQAVYHLQEARQPYSAILAANDRMAMGALSALRELGLRVPEDVSVIGYDDMLEAAYFTPPLTTIRQDLDLLAQQSIEYLVSIIENPDTPVQQRVLYPELIVRKTTQAVNLQSRASGGDHRDAS